MKKKKDDTNKNIEINNDIKESIKINDNNTPIFNETDLYPQTNADYIFAIKHLFFTIDAFKSGNVEYNQLIKMFEEIVAYLKSKNPNVNFITSKKDTDVETQTSMSKHFTLFLKELFSKGRRLKLEYVVLKRNEKTDEFEVLN